MTNDMWTITEQVKTTNNQSDMHFAYLAQCTCHRSWTIPLGSLLPWPAMTASVVAPGGSEVKPGNPLSFKDIRRFLLPGASRCATDRWGDGDCGFFFTGGIWSETETVLNLDESRNLEFLTKFFFSFSESERYPQMFDMFGKGNYWRVSVADAVGDSHVSPNYGAT